MQAAQAEEASRLLLRQYARGEVSAPVTLMHLLLQTGSPDGVARLVEEAQGLSQSAWPSNPTVTERFGLLRRMIAENTENMRRTAEMIRLGLDHEHASSSPELGVERYRAMFDRLVQHSSDASVALYSLGNPRLLQAATDEVVQTIRDWGLMAPGRKLLDIGCGIGRFTAALAPDFGSVTGIDLSAGMIEAARQKCAGLANVRLLQCQGGDLSLFPDGEFDVLLAVDVFPYLFLSGASLVELHFQEAARILRPAGDFLILNFSYRGDPELDQADVSRFAAASCFTPVRNGARPFNLWDGLAFHLKRAE